MYEYGVARPDLIYVANEIARGHALQHHCRRRAVGYARWKLDQAVCGDKPFFGVGTDHRSVSNPVTGFQMVDAVTHCVHGARCLHAGYAR